MEHKLHGAIVSKRARQKAKTPRIPSGMRGVLCSYPISEVRGLAPLGHTLHVGKLPIRRASP